MPLARIITSQPGPDEEHLKQQLQAAGYDVEVVAPGQPGRADLEIDLEYLSPEQALEAATRMADDGADVFIAPGVVREQPAAESAPVVAIAQPAVPPEALPQHFAPAAPQPVSEVAIPDPARGPSLFQRIGDALADSQERRAAAAEERRLARERREQEEQERHRQEALELQRRREQEEGARAEQERLHREQLTRQALLLAERARQFEETERSRRAEMIVEPSLRAQPPDPQRLAAMEAQMQAAPAMPKPATPVAPRPTTTAAAPRPLPRSHAAAPALPARHRIPSPREQQWQRAALLASLLAVGAMLGFAAAMNLNPGAPLSDTLLRNNAQQTVPFGPATISPPLAAAPAPAATPARASSVSPVRKPLARPSAAREKPVRRQAPRARRSRKDFVADDEVVVRHYPSASSPTSQRTETSGVRRYSDQ